MAAQTLVFVNVCLWLQTVQTLANLVCDLNTQLDEVKTEKLQQTTSSGLEHTVDKIQSQVGNLAARMTLMENRVSIIEAKVSSYSTVQFRFVSSLCLRFIDGDIVGVLSAVE